MTMYSLYSTWRLHEIAKSREAACGTAFFLAGALTPMALQRCQRCQAVANLPPVSDRNETPQRTRLEETLRAVVGNACR